MAGPTTLSVGSVTITANGGHTGDLLAAIIAASSTATVVSVGSLDSSIPAPPGGPGPFELVINPGYTGSMSIPSGYAFVINGATDDPNTITSTDPTTAIVLSNLSTANYTGAAGTVLGAGGGGTVDSTGNDATMAFFGDYSVTASGSGDTIGVNGGAASDVTVVGSGDTINSGGGSPSVAGSSAQAAGAGSGPVQIFNIGTSVTGTQFNVGANANDLVFISSPTTVNATDGSATVVTGSGGIVTLNASGGNQVVFDFQGGNLINAGGSTEFVTAIGDASSTYNSSTGGADTIFASTAIDYSNSAGEANSLFFLGGAGAVTVSAAAAETVFGGTGGGSYSVGATSFSFFGGGGDDTLAGGTGNASILAFGNSNEALTVDQSDSSTAKGNIFITFGTNDSINASNADGGNFFQIVNQALTAQPTGTFTGNSTLVGSNLGNDVFTVFVDNSSPPSHTVSIGNWQSSDALVIDNLGSADGSLNATDLAAVTAFEGGSSQSLTLSDGTTILFTGAKPSTIIHS